MNGSRTRGAESRPYDQSRPASRWVLALLCGCGLVAGSAGAAWAQSDLGGQRIGTSSGTFLKIPVDARSSALAGANSSYVSGPAALFSNPAGLGIERERGAQFSRIGFPAGITAAGTAICLPFAPIRGAIGLGMTAVRTEMAETDEYHPLGTGRLFSYSAWSILLGASRSLTDKLSFGLTAKFYHEGLGTEVGGPDLSSWLVDAGAIYFIGYRDARIGLALSDFGPDLTPQGHFVSRRNGEKIRYLSFSPPTFFRFSFAIDPIRGERWKLVTIGEVGHPADNRESMRFGAELDLDQRLFLRAGYDAAADELKLHAGFGARVRVGANAFRVDYAFAAGGYFGDVHRWTLEAQW